MAPISAAQSLTAAFQRVEESSAESMAWPEVSHRVAAVFARAADAERSHHDEDDEDVEAGATPAGCLLSHLASMRLLPPAPSATSSPSLKTLPSTALGSPASSEAAASDSEASEFSDEEAHDLGLQAGQELLVCRRWEATESACGSRSDEVESAAQGEEAEAAFRGLCRRLIGVFADAADSDTEDW